jgi:hypothetical protein
MTVDNFLSISWSEFDSCSKEKREEVRKLWEEFYGYKNMLALKDMKDILA